MEAEEKDLINLANMFEFPEQIKVGQCSLTLSNPT